MVDEYGSLKIFALGTNVYTRLYSVNTSLLLHRRSAVVLRSTSLRGGAFSSNAGLSSKNSRDKQSSQRILPKFESRESKERWFVRTKVKCVYEEET